MAKMSATKYEELLMNPAGAQAEQGQLLADFIRQYPYCQSARMLYLKFLHLNNHPHYAQELKLTAACVPNRSRLKTLIEGGGEAVENEGKSAAAKRMAQIETAGETLVPNPENVPSLPAFQAVPGDYFANLPEDELNQVPAKNHLVDRFIEESPRIHPVKGEFFKPEATAHQSKAEQREIVTETLAQILAQQGSFLKAIEIYETLSLKYPEKSGYFANLIKKLKEEIK